MIIVSHVPHAVHVTIQAVVIPRVATQHVVARHVVSARVARHVGHVILATHAVPIHAVILALFHSGASGLKEVLHLIKNVYQEKPYRRRFLCFFCGLFHERYDSFIKKLANLFMDAV